LSANFRVPVLFVPHLPTRSNENCTTDPSVESAATVVAESAAVVDFPAAAAAAAAL